MSICIDLIPESRSITTYAAQWNALLCESLPADFNVTVRFYSASFTANVQSKDLYVTGNIGISYSSLGSDYQQNINYHSIQTAVNNINPAVPHQNMKYCVIAILVISEAARFYPIRELLYLLFKCPSNSYQWGTLHDILTSFNKCRDDSHHLPITMNDLLAVHPGGFFDEQVHLLNEWLKSHMVK